MTRPIRTAAEQFTVLAAGDRYRFLATAEDTGGAYALWHATLPPGGGPPLHKHSREDERFDVLAGTVRFSIDGVVHDVGPGDSVAAPRGSVHAFKNISNKPAEMLIHISPGGMEKMFLLFGRLSEGPDDAPDPVTPEMIGRIVEACARYGIEVVGPPIA